MAIALFSPVVHCGPFDCFQQPLPSRPSLEDLLYSVAPGQHHHLLAPAPAIRPPPWLTATNFYSPLSGASGLSAPSPTVSWHYIPSPSHTQGRHVCPTCSKAFSRPSSLQTHLHTHTGEKPFQCPYPGCGKAFSVRSNMRRHERGCHSQCGASPPSL